MNRPFPFFQLDVWREAVEYANHIYSITSTFPKEEVYGLASQLRRAAVSVSSNLAEGSGRTSKAEFARYVEIAYGSLMESVSQLCISQSQGWISGDEFEACSSEAQRIARMLSGLKRSLKPSPG